VEVTAQLVYHCFDKKPARGSRKVHVPLESRCYTIRVCDLESHEISLDLSARCQYKSTDYLGCSISPSGRVSIGVFCVNTKLASDRANAIAVQLSLRIPSSLRNLDSNSSRGNTFTVWFRAQPGKGSEENLKFWNERKAVIEESFQNRSPQVFFNRAAAPNDSSAFPKFFMPLKEYEGSLDELPRIATGGSLEAGNASPPTVPPDFSLSDAGTDAGPANFSFSPSLSRSELPLVQGQAALNAEPPVATTYASGPPLHPTPQWISSGGDQAISEVFLSNDEPDSTLPSGFDSPFESDVMAATSSRSVWHPGPFLLASPFPAPTHSPTLIPTVDAGCGL